jgi:hypothetical protein
MHQTDPRLDYHREQRARREARAHEASALVDAAKEAEQARDPGSLTFRSVHDALTWWSTKGRLLRGCNAAWARTENMPTKEGNGNGQPVYVSVQGGKGGDLHGALATLITVEKMIAGCGLRPVECVNVAVADLYAVETVRSGGRPPAVSPDRYPWILVARYLGFDDDAPEQGGGVGRPWTEEQIGQRLGVSQQTAGRHLALALRHLDGEMRRCGVVR